MQRKLVIFDLDETLVHATQVPLAGVHDMEVPPYFVYQRPFVHELLGFAFEFFDVGVWSSSSKEYVAAVTEHLFSNYPLKFAWSVEKCVQRPDPRTNGYVYIKDLRKLQSLGFKPERITIIDDSPEKVQRQPRSHLPVKPFTGDFQDSELLEIKSALQSMLSQSRASAIS
ncbi:HAD family hydrolase [Acidovorax sp.]|uniref:HAD family hydrolase n=1 Tax=Acidovorax sp. TaxID=1872122 RepID=UPI003D031C88